MKFSKTTYIISGSILTIVLVGVVFRKQLSRVVLISKKKYLDAKSLEIFKKLHPDFKKVLLQFTKAVKDELGYDVLYTSGTRTETYQGITNSLHRFSLATDMNFYKDGKNILNKQSSKEAWKPVVDIAKRYNLVWGGNFTNVDYDPIHFDYGNIMNKRGSELAQMVKEGKVDSNGFVKLS